MSIYLNNPWHPVENMIVKDHDIRAELQKKGFVIVPIEDLKIVEDLNRLYDDNHNESEMHDGMFHSIYSQDIEYRQRVNLKLGAILEPFFESLLENYRTLVSSYVIKNKNSDTEFQLHQDGTGVDEFKYSPLSVWIPLHDVTKENGCMGVVPSSHHFFSPYRHASFPFPWDSIRETVEQYLQPIPIKKGEALLFDNRILHNSYINQTDSFRKGVVCALLPKDAILTYCHKPTYTYGGKVEIIQQSDDFVLTYKKFHTDGKKRPEVGKSVDWVDDPYGEISSNDFETLCKRFGIEKNMALESSVEELGKEENQVKRKKGALNRMLNYISGRN